MGNAMSKTIKLILVLVAIIVAAVFLNPSAEKHRMKMKEAIAERSQLEKVLGVGALTAFASRYHSLGIASYTTVNEKLTSVGVVGLVFVME